MTSHKDESRKPAQEPKKTRANEKDESVELQVEELEERIAPMKYR
jgi:uncharacterized small protein (DUF1192 family)